MAVGSDSVFVLDDDPVLLSLLRQELVAQGHAVETFRSSASFFERIGDDEPDGCLVLDLCLNEENGLDIQEKLVQRGSRLPIVFISGQGDVRSTAQAMRSGAVDFLVKPFFSRELFAAVGNALERSRKQRERHARRTDAEQRLQRLTPREREVCMHVAAGQLNKHIAAALGTTEKTIKVHRARAMAKLEVSSVAELVRLIDRAGASDCVEKVAPVNR